MNFLSGLLFFLNRGDIMTYAKIECPDCGKIMAIRGVDCLFKGTQDEYHICWECKRSASAKVRYGKVCKIKITPKEE